VQEKVYTMDQQNSSMEGSSRIYALGADLLGEIMEFNGNSSDIIAFATTCSHFLALYPQTTVFGSNELCIFLFKASLKTIDIDGPFFQLATIEELDWFNELSVRQETRRLMNVEIQVKDLSEVDLIPSFINYAQQGKRVLQDRLYSITEVHPLLFTIMKFFQVDITPILDHPFLPIEVTRLRDLISRMNNQEPIESIPKDLADNVGPYLHNCICSTISTMTFIEMVYTKTSNELKQLGTSIWKHIVTAEPLLLKMATKCQFKTKYLTEDEKRDMVVKCPKLFRELHTAESVVVMLLKSPKLYSELTSPQKNQQNIVAIVPRLLCRNKAIFKHIPENQRTKDMEILVASCCVPEAPFRSIEAMFKLVRNHLKFGCDIEKILNVCHTAVKLDNSKLRKYFEENGYLTHWKQKHQSLNCNQQTSHQPPLKKRRLNPEDY
jgi:hypothetical protein